MFDVVAYISRYISLIIKLVCMHALHLCTLMGLYIPIMLLGEVLDGTYTLCDEEFRWYKDMINCLKCCNLPVINKSDILMMLQYNIWRAMHSQYTHKKVKLSNFTVEQVFVEYLCF